MQTESEPQLIDGEDAGLCPVCRCRIATYPAATTREPRVRTHNRDRFGLRERCPGSNRAAIFDR